MVVAVVLACSGDWKDGRLASATDTSSSNSMRECIRMRGTRKQRTAQRHAPGVLLAHQTKVGACQRRNAVKFLHQRGILRPRDGA